MESRKTTKKRTLNEYRQVKDSVYKQPHITRDSFKHMTFISTIKGLCKQFHNDNDLGGAVRRALKKYENRT